jgi:hypothetical protein
MSQAETTPRASDFSGLPGAKLIERGLADASNGTLSIEALLVAIAAPRLVRLGIEIPPVLRALPDAELRLYRDLCKRGTPDPYSHYNALLRELVSFERALEHRVSRAHKSHDSDND